MVDRFLTAKLPNNNLLNEINQLLDHCSNIYYNSGEDSPLTDEEFDAIIKKYRKFRPYKDGSRPKVGKRIVNVSHNFPKLVGTLNKCNTIKEVKDWFKKLNIPANKEIIVVVSEKKDGNSVTISYSEENKVKVALTRGEDGKGADLTHLFKNRDPGLFQSKLLMKKMGGFGIKYEAIVNDQIFNELCTKMERTYANPRSLVAGILSSEDGIKYSDYIVLVPIRIQFEKQEITRLNELNFIDMLNQNSPIKFKYKIINGNIDTVIKKLDKIYQNYIKNKRSILDHPIDGLVIEILDQDIRDKLGRKDSENNFEVALKFPYLVKRSKVRDIEFYYGLSGRITPVVVFDEVIFNGAKCTKASISNYNRFKELSLSIGDDIFVEYRNDVLCYITKDPNSLKDSKHPINFPIKCLKCGHTLSLNKTGVFVRCENVKCPGRIKGRIVNYLKKLEIKGIKDSTIDKLVDEKVIRKIQDLYTMDYERIADIPGLGPKSAENIKKAITGKVPYDYEILGALGIDGFGRKKAKIVCKVMNMDKILNICDNRKEFYNKLLTLEGFSDILANRVSRGIRKNRKTIALLIKLAGCQSFSESLKKSGVSYNFVFTGFRNPVLQTKLEEAGHLVKSSVSSKTNFLVAANSQETSAKLTKARELNIPIITIEQARSMIE